MKPKKVRTTVSPTARLLLTTPHMHRKELKSKLGASLSCSGASPLIRPRKPGPKLVATEFTARSVNGSGLRVPLVVPEVWVMTARCSGSPEPYCTGAQAYCTSRSSMNTVPLSRLSIYWLNSSYTSSAGPVQGPPRRECRKMTFRRPSSFLSFSISGHRSGVIMMSESRRSVSFSFSIIVFHCPPGRKSGYESMETLAPVILSP